MKFDKSLTELEQYKPDQTAQTDFAAFWKASLAESQAQPLNANLSDYPYMVERVKVHKIEFDGFGPDTKVAGLYLTPQVPLEVGKDGRTPTIVYFHGYSDNGGLPATHLHWALQGFNVLTIDIRGQGGLTPDNVRYPVGGAIGLMTKGLGDPKDYYYRYVYLDCVRAIDFLSTRSEVGPIILTGGSQGGGLSLVIAALAADQAIVGTMPDVPYLCHFERAVKMFEEGPYQELVDFWRFHPDQIEESFRTLTYFDALNFASMIKCPVLMSVGLLDKTCPPSASFAAYNHIKATKQIILYPYSGHDGGMFAQEEAKYRFVRSLDFMKNE